MSGQEPIRALNENLAGEPRAVIVSLDGAATLIGPHRSMREQIFAAEIPEELAHAELAAAFGDEGPAAHLEMIVEDETGHYETTEKNLCGG